MLSKLGPDLPKQTKPLTLILVRELESPVAFDIPIRQSPAGPAASPDSGLSQRGG